MTPTTDKLADALRLIERMRDALETSISLRAEGTNDALSDEASVFLADHAASLAAPPAQGEWVMVPRVPSNEMLYAAGTMNNYDIDAGGRSDDDHIAWWEAMLAAAPQPAPELFPGTHAALDALTIREQPAPAPVQVDDSAGIARAAAYIQQKADDYAEENCGLEPDTNAATYRYGQAGEDYHHSLIELAEEVAGLAKVPCTVPPAGWQCSRTKGHGGPCAATPVAQPPAPGEAELPPLPEPAWTQVRPVDNDGSGIVGKLFDYYTADQVRECQLAAIAATERVAIRGTPSRRLRWILDELAKLFPDAHSMLASDPPEPKYIAAIAALAQQRAPDAVRELPTQWRQLAEDNRRYAEHDNEIGRHDSAFMLHKGADALEARAAELESALATIDSRQEARGNGE